jgi:phage terminase large subunit GpA-like protein
MREIMDAFTDPTIREGWFMKSAQVAWTTALENVIGYYVDQDPSPVLLIQPTLQVAEDFSKTRLAPMVRDTPKLRGQISDAKSRNGENTLLRKKFPGGHLVLAGANAPAGLASHPIRVLLFDEVDRYPASAGTEGDPISLGMKRTTAFWNRRVFGGSTPGIKGASLIEAKYLASDQRRRFVPCPHCGETQVLKWAQVKFENKDPATARYLCEHCGTLWSDVERWAALHQAKWRPTKPFNGIAGWHMNALASTFVKLEDVVREFLEATGNPEKLKAFTNTTLAETWEETGATIEPGSLLERREQYGPENIPAGVLALTVGGDTQDDRVELQLLGWGADEECWPIEQVVFRGDPGKASFWKEHVDPYLLQKFSTEDGRELRIEAAAIDSGGHHTQAVYDFVVARKRRRVWAIKGMAGPGRLAWPKKASRTAKSRAMVFILGVDTIKGVLYGRLNKVQEPGPGYIHLPASADDEFCKQLTSEKAATKYVRGRPTLVWSPRSEGIAQEAQDCWIYGYAAMIGLGGLKFLDRAAKAAGVSIRRRPARSTAIESPPAVEPPVVAQKPLPPNNPPARTSWMPRRGGWMKR